MNIRKSILEIKKQKTTILIALVFLSLMSPKAWGYAENKLPPSFSEEPFSSGDTSSSGASFSLSRAILTDEKGFAICQVNLVENQEFLPQFAEPGSSNAFPPLDLPECEQQNLDIVAQYAEQAWMEKEVAIAPLAYLAGMVGISCFAGILSSTKSAGGGGVGAFGGFGVGVSSVVGDILENIDRLKSLHAARGVVYSVGAVLTATAVSGGIGAGVGYVTGVFCSDVAGGRRRIFYQEESNEKDL